MNKKNLIRISVISFCICLMLSNVVLGHTIPTSFIPYSDSGWLLNGTNSHMGSKTTEYYYASTETEDYASHVNAGISMWGSNINMSEDASGIGVITVVDLPNEGYTATCSAGSAVHRDAWTITINMPVFDGLGRTDDHKKRTLAHEIGHAYGLGDLSSSYSSQMMYGGSSSIKNVTSNDIWGMKICTEEHTSHNYNEYIFYSSSSHYKICGDCRGAVIVSHSGQPASYWLPYGTETVCMSKPLICSDCSGITGYLYDYSHTYTNNCDTTCNDCGYIRSVLVHVYTNSCDTTCNVCGAIRSTTHIYSNSCDTTCNVCGYTRSITHGPFQDIYNHTDFFTSSCQARHVYDHTCTVCNTITGPAYGSYYTHHYYYTYYYNYTEFDYPNNRKRHWYDKKCNTCSVVYDLVPGVWIPL